MIHIDSDDAPKPAGHYSQAVVHGDLVFVSGQLPGGPAASDPRSSIEAQTDRTLQHLEAILSAAGSDRAHVLKTTIFITQIELWDRVNRRYADFFGEHRPARSVVAVHELHHGWQIEIEAVAARTPTEVSPVASVGGTVRPDDEVRDA